MEALGKDLGTYHLRVELQNGDGWIETWETGRRYTHGGPFCTRLDAIPILPSWKSEEDLFQGMLYMYTDGNYACDCNKALFLARAYQKPEPVNPLCGHTMTLHRLTAIRPDGTEVGLRLESKDEDELYEI